MKLKKLHTGVAGITLLKPMPLFLEIGEVKKRRNRKVRRKK
jgi:hypothetical protein